MTSNFHFRFNFFSLTGKHADLEFMDQYKNTFDSHCSQSLDKLETTPLRVVVSYVYLVFSQPPACLHQAM